MPFAIVVHTEIGTSRSRGRAWTLMADRAERTRRERDVNETMMPKIASEVVN